jgi:hypothetical protein
MGRLTRTSHGNGVWTSTIRSLDIFDLNRFGRVIQDAIGGSHAPFDTASFELGWHVHALYSLVQRPYS